MARIEEQDLAVVLERVRRVVEARLERLTEAVLEIDDLVLAHVEGDATAQRLGVRLPALELPVQDVERRQRAGVARLVFEHRDVRVDGLVEILDLGLVQPCDLVEDRAASFDVGRQFALLLVDAVEQVLEPLRLAIELLERREGAGVVRIGVVDRAVLRERVVDLLHLAHEHAPKPKPQRDLDLEIAHVTFDGGGVRGDDAIPLAGDLGRPLRIGARLIVGRGERERRQVPIERLRGSRTRPS